MAETRLTAEELDRLERLWSARHGQYAYADIEAVKAFPALLASARALLAAEAERDRLRRALENAKRDGLKRKRQELDPDRWMHGHNEGWVAGIEYALSEIEKQDIARAALSPEPSHVD